MSWPSKIVIAPDSFKGSLSAAEVAGAIAIGLSRVWPGASIVLCPMADGGEGTLDAVLSRGGRRQVARVTGAGGQPVDAAFGLVDRDGDRVGVIEIATVVGITDREAMTVAVERRSTRGVGELMLRALDAGARSLLIGLGGSSTNDGGAGLLAGIGARLYDGDGCELDPTPEGLAKLVRLDLDALDPRIAETPMVIMSDVDNPLCGERGATAIFGPQKGVSPEGIGLLDSRVGIFADQAERALGRSARDRPGAGAAGGLGFILQALGGEFRSGAEVVADLIGLDAALDEATLLITGEGRTDGQTLLGKTPLVAARRAARLGIPAVLLSGAVDQSALPALASRFAGCFSLTFGPSTLAQCVDQAETLLADKAEQLARFAAALHAGRS